MSDAPEWLTLDGEESVVWSGRPRTMSVAGTVAGTAVVTILVLVGVGAVWSGAVDGLVGPSVTDLLPGGVLPALAALAVVWLVARVAWAYLTLVNVDYVLTDRNLYKKTGVASERVKRVGLDRVQSSSLSKDLLGNVFDYGSVAVSTAGGSGVEMVITDLANPDELRRELRRLVNEQSGGATGGAGGGDAALRAVLEEARELRETTESLREVLEG
jgi:membrane protein YdbS with pleckstrin-like domain